MFIILFISQSIILLIVVDTNPGISDVYDTKNCHYLFTQV